MLTRRAARVAGEILMFASIGLAQEHLLLGSIAGRVFDQMTKGAISYANVVVLGCAIGTATDQDGCFRISNIPAGSYEVQISVIGYKPLTKGAAVHPPNAQSELEFPMIEGNIELSEVQVCAAHFLRGPDTPLSTRSFSYKELRQTAGGLDDVVRSVSILPGIAQPKPDRNDLIVRGGAPSENLFLVDNVEVAYINHFSTQGAGGGAISIIDPDLLDGASFSAGGFGVRYGDKLSSVLNIALREGRSDRFHGKATVSATQLGLNVEGPLPQKGSYLVSVRKSYLDFAFKLYGFGFAPHFWDFLGKASYPLGIGDKLTVLVLGAIDKIDFFNDTDEHRYNNSRLLFSDQNHFVGALIWRHLFSDGFTTLTAHYSRSELEYLQFTEDLVPRFQSSAMEREISVRGDMAIQCGASTEIAVGVESKCINLNSAIDLELTGTGSGQDVSANQFVGGKPLKAAVYGQISKVFGSLKLTLGLRGDYFGLIEQHAVVAPRFSSTLALSGVTNVTASIGRYCQAPSYIWLAANSFNRGLSYLGADQIVVGIDHLLAEDLSIDLEGYLKRYFHYPTSINRPALVMANTGAGPGGMGEGYASFGLDSLVSRGTGLARGIELSIQKKLSKIPLYGMLSVSYGETRFTGFDGVSRPSDYDQRCIINIGGGYIIDEKWEVSAKFRFYTGRPYTPFGLNGSQSSEERNSARVGVNHQLDIRVARRWRIGVALLETYLDVQNVYNRKPIDAPIFSERRKRVEQVPTLGIVPTVGIAWQF